MDRVIVYAGQTPLETDILRSGQFGMVGNAKTNEAILGTATCVSGFNVVPTSPASLSVVIGPGMVFQQAQLESSAVSSLPADTHTILKQGILLDNQTLTFVAPTATGYAQNFLIEVQYQDADTGATVLPYYNADNPSVSFPGPGGSGTAQNTMRRGAVAYQIKAGIAATSGTQTSPSPDAGWAGLYVVTLAQGQTSVTAGNISTYAGAPFIPVTLPNVPLGVQAGSWVFFIAGGSSTAYTGALAPIPSILTPGMEILGYFGTANTGTSPTLSINSLGTKPILKQGGGAPAPGDISGFIPFVLSGAGSAWVINGQVASDIAAVAPTFISTAVTIQVGGTAPAASTTIYPNYFATLQAALNWVQQYTILSTGSVKFQLAANQQTITAPIAFSHPNGSRISIVGATMTGAVPVNADFACTGSTSAARANDAATNLTMLRSRYASELRFTGGASFSTAGNFGGLIYTLVTSDGTAGADLFGAIGGQVIFNSSNFHGAASGRNVLAAAGATINATSCGSVAAQNGWAAEGGTINYYMSIIGDGCSQNGFNAISGTIRNQSGSLFGNGNAGYGVQSQSGGYVSCGPSPVFAQNGSGVNAVNRGGVSCDSGNFSSNGNAIVCTAGGFVSAQSATGSGNTGYSVYCDSMGDVSFFGSSIGSTSGMLVALNTLGSHGQYIAG